MLQYLAYMDLQEVQFPPNAQIYNKELKDLIEFGFIKPANLAKRFIPEDLSWKGAVEGFFQEIEEFNELIIFGTIGCLVIFVLSVGTAIKSTRELSWGKVREFRDKFFFNGMLRTITVTQMKQCIVLGTLIQQALIAEVPFTSAQKVKAGIMAVYFSFVLAVPAYMLFQRRQQLKSVEQEKKMGRIFAGLNLRSDSSGLYYFPMFLLRFFLYVMISSLYTVGAVIEIQCLIFLNLFFGIWYFQARPHFQRSRIIQEMVHEVIIMIGSYHLLLYSNATHYELQFIGGYSSQFWLLVLSVFNFAKIFVEALEDYRRKRFI